uniref:Uncharacterized protein n=1 Tax=Vespula pensylvanica TaxID=30213 RepID=A0A834UG39_VESPE|nr:hypothetical protein H0235_000727 [Vespula pensylvanica]
MKPICGSIETDPRIPKERTSRKDKSMKGNKKTMITSISRFNYSHQHILERAEEADSPKNHPKSGFLRRLPRAEALCEKNQKSKYLDRGEESIESNHMDCREFTGIISRRYDVTYAAGCRERVARTDVSAE